MYTFQQYKKLPGIQKLDEKDQAHRYERMREETYFHDCAAAISIEQNIPVDPIVNPASFYVTTYVDGNQITDWNFGYVSPLETTVSVDWGDGITSSFVNPSSISHEYGFVGLTYSVGATVTISNFENLGTLDFSSDSLLESRQITMVEGLVSFTSLTALNLSQNLIVNGNALVTQLPTSLIDLNLSYNTMAGRLDADITVIALTTFDVSHNNLKTFEPSFYLPSVLKSVDISYNTLFDYFPPGLFHLLPPSVEKFHGHHNLITDMEANTLPDSLNDFDFSFNDLSQFGLDHILEDLDSLFYSNGTFKLQSQTTGVSPTGNGAIAKAALISRGCTVITD